jgi:haloacetate dehalogenase
MFEGFETRSIAVNDVTINVVVKGNGPPLLLLHGYPQTHVMWHKIAPALAERFTVVASDLRGYGDSSKPAGDDQHLTYSKRSTAADQVALMTTLGFDRFRVAGHDRGGRVTHRLLLDHPDRVIRGLPETLIGGNPEYYLRNIGSWGRADAFTPEAFAEYLRCFSDPACIHATCEDYRAAASIDLEHHKADGDRKIACPLLVLWGEKGLIGRIYDPVAIWKEYAVEVIGRGVPSGHFLPEEAPRETLDSLLEFFAA